MCACSEKVDDAECYLDFQVKHGIGNTKAVLINDESEMISEMGSFDVMIISDAVSEKDVVNYDSGKWVSAKKHTLGAVDIFAIAPSGYGEEHDMTYDTDAHLMSFTYDSEAEAFHEKDLLCGYYIGVPIRGTVPISFHHPLSSIVLKMGSTDGGYTIKGISISGAATSGTCAVQFDSQLLSAPSVSWTQLINGGDIETACIEQTPDPDDYITNPFLVIPQTIGTESEAKLNVTITAGGTDRVLSCSLAGTTWGPGSYYIYRVSIFKDKLSLETSVAPWGVESEKWPVY